MSKRNPNEIPSCSNPDNRSWDSFNIDRNGQPSYPADPTPEDILRELIRVSELNFYSEVRCRCSKYGQQNCHVCARIHCCDNLLMVDAHRAINKIDQQHDDDVIKYGTPIQVEEDEEKTHPHEYVLMYNKTIVDVAGLCIEEENEEFGLDYNDVKASSVSPAGFYVIEVEPYESEEFYAMTDCTRFRFKSIKLKTPETKEMQMINAGMWRQYKNGKML